MGDLNNWQKLALWLADRIPKNKLTQDIAYKIISDRQVGFQSGATKKDIVRNIFSSKPKDEDTNKYMFVYGADARRPETSIGQSYDWANDIKENGYQNVKSYEGILNPYGEYLVDSRNKGLIEALAKAKYSPVSNINNEYIDWNTFRMKKGVPYYDDVHGYRPTFHFDQNGNGVISSSDLYDFGKNYVGDFADLYAERSGNENDPAFIMELQRRALNSVGQPYLLVQKNIPIRYVDNPQGNEIWRIDNFRKEVLDPITDRDIARITGSGYIEPAVITAHKKGGKIHIKKKNRGKFTESAKRAGMGVQEFARHVLANKDEYSSILIKRANFARNAKKFKHKSGGSITLKWL